MENGHLRVGRGGDTEQLGNWLKNCRQKARKGTLAPWQRAELTACGVALPSPADPQNSSGGHPTHQTIIEPDARQGAS
ncbi:helicase associated domain-containing protein [Kitasatospora brasiliensis]|uniref:helicase associated domain-containing protein n=1 Tax=Kitasatospora brasiliensis TaxID=3058040 RepID=UPI003D788E8B